MNKQKIIFPGLKEHELPQYILVCDFGHFRLYDLESGQHHEFRLEKLADNLFLFDFISGYKRHTFKEQDPVNIKAAELMGKLHDQLKGIGYAGHELEVYLVRLLFCLFADDTNIFEKGIFEEYIRLRTKEDGSDLAMHIDSVFVVLSTDKGKRFSNIDEQLAAFPYVNGKLFDERVALASFDSKMRNVLLDCCALDWSKISPAIFGSLFQSVMDEKAKRNLGAHYTSEKNILKLIKPLFLDELRAEFEKVKGDNRAMDRFHEKLSKLRFLDPACGCGNFLIIAYRELRLLEIDLLKAKFKNQIATNIDNYINLNVDQFYGIEYEDFPAQIAQVAMWLIDHQMNQLVSEEFGEYFVRLPLKKAATIVHGNALRTDWQSLLNPVNSIDVYAKHANIYLIEEPATEYKTINVQAETYKVHKGAKPEPDKQVKFDYILGNPPFVGTAYQSTEQKEDTAKIFDNISSSGMLDYVTAWYIKAAKYMNESNREENKLPYTKTAFVSTNSIAQGEQVGVLWNELYNKYHIKIHFAHQTFRWGNEAKGNAAVHVVIIGFANFDITNKKIFVYDDIKAEAHEVAAKNINPYLIEGSDNFLKSIPIPICNVPKMQSGSAARDGGFLTLNNEEKKELTKQYPSTKKFLKRFVTIVR